ncbi:MAG: hypothetical protein J3K34DRAFT_521778 [Monoraphidium minutum]|nr:MAG: hypothetical protein J3K34DRAFT_521778 [Monoraphidium minutum]
MQLSRPRPPALAARPPWTRRTVDCLATSNDADPGGAGGSAGAGGSGGRGASPAAAAAALPAPSDAGGRWPCLTLAAEPCAALVDTAFVGRLGAAQLAGVGVALSVYNTATKLVQVPLLSIATTTVAAARGAEEQQQRQAGQAQGPQQHGKEGAHDGAAADSADSAGQSRVSSAAAAALLVAAAVGAGVAALLLTWGPALAAFWGVVPGSALRQPALDFLTLRALGAPISIVLLVAQGCFRGLQDTRTPFFATLLTNALNIGLDYYLIFVVGLGVKGAALATIAAQLLPCAWLLHRLGSRCQLRVADAATLRSLAGLLAPTAFLVLRTVAIAGTYAFGTALTARAGAEAAAAHQVCNQLWLASSLLSDALAVAAQSLVARSLAAGQPAAARRVIGRTVGMAAALGLVMAAAMAGGAGALPRLFTSDPGVLPLVTGVAWSFVAATQPINAMAFVWDGVLFGAGGFKYACAQMALSCAPAVAIMLLLAGGSSASMAPVFANVLL